MQVLRVISSREKPTQQDLIATLATFFNKHQTLVREAVKEAGLKLTEA